MPQHPSTDLADVRDRYLDLLAKALTRYGMDSSLHPVGASGQAPVVRKGVDGLQRLLAKRSLRLSRHVPNDDQLRAAGRDLPVLAETSVGLQRLANVRTCIEAVLAEDVPGDVLEAGVWRGGTAIYMCGVLAAHGAHRVVWAADSFQGMPTPGAAGHPGDIELGLHEEDLLAVPRHVVEANFERYGLLSDDVRFLEGWFEDTLPGAPIERLALLRIDADLYASTTQVLEALYDKVSPGGFVIIDDYGCYQTCRDAVDDFRRARGVSEPIEWIDWTGVFWRRSA